MRKNSNKIHYKYDYSKLKGRIIEIFDSQQSFADAIGMGRVSLSHRMNGKLDFSQTEILMSIKALELNIDDISGYFFNQIKD